MKRTVMAVMAATVMSGCVSTAPDRSYLIEPMTKTYVEATQCFNEKQISPEAYGNYLYAYEYQRAVLLSPQEQTQLNQAVSEYKISPKTDCRLVTLDMFKTYNQVKQLHESLVN